MYSITYSSTAEKPFSDADLATLLREGREVAVPRDVTGALLYHNGRFIHLLEGPEKAVRKIFAHIAADPRHRIDLAADDRSDSRRFANWTVGYRPVGASAPSPGEGFDNFCAASGSAQNAADDLGGDRSLFDWLYSTWLMGDTARSLSQPEERTDSLYRSQRISAPIPSEAVERHVASVTEALAAAANVAGESRVVTSIVAMILRDVISGALKSGDRVNDVELSTRLGVSRTPVREAILKLRDVGIIEIFPGRFTRIAVVELATAVDLLTMMFALFDAVIDEVVGRLDVSILAAMREDLLAYQLAVPDGDAQAIATPSINFYRRVIEATRNAMLLEPLSFGLAMLNLANTHFDALFGLDVLGSSMEETLAAVVAGDHARVRRSMAILRSAVYSDGPLSAELEWTI